MPLLDGRITATEWQDAATIQLADFARVHVKQSREYVWIGVELSAQKTGTVDIYLASADGSIYDLHSSAKLGERKLEGTHWPDTWTWWNNLGWVATVSRVDSWENRTFLDQPGREFQIAKSRFPGKRWKLMFEFMTPGAPDWRMSRFPESASNTNANGWYEISL